MPFTTPEFNRGLSKIAQTLASKDAIASSGYQSGIESGAKVDSLIAKALLDEANARKTNTRLDNQPGARLNFLSGHGAVTLPQVKAYENWRTTGQWGEGVEPLPAETIERLNEAVRIMAANNAGTADSDASQIMSGMKTGTEQSAIARALAGDVNAMAVTKASPIYSQNADSVRLNRYSGDQHLDADMLESILGAKDRHGASGAGGGKMPTADIQIVDRLTKPAGAGGVGMSEPEAFEWLQLYKNNPQNAAMNMYAKMSQDNLFRPPKLQLSPEQIMQVVNDTMKAFAVNIQPQSETGPGPDFVWTPDGIIPAQ